MKIQAKVFKYGDNVDTDAILPARYMNMSAPEDLSPHCMEDIDKDFAKKVKKGDIITAGANFGCGSSREHAPIAIKAAGVACVVAKSFARIFYRNAINIGLAIVEYQGQIDNGDEIEIDFANGKINNLTRNEEGAFPPFPEFLQDIIDKGGLLPAMEGQEKRC